MNVIQYNPNRWANTVFDRFFSDPPSWGVEPTEAAPAVFAPRVDIREVADSIGLTAELPGVARESLKAEVVKGVLVLSGEKKDESEQKENGFYRRERTYGSFKRSFALPDEVDADGIVAEFTDGVLRVTLPKRPEAAARQVTITAGTEVAKQIGVS